MAALLPLTVLWVWWLTRSRLRPMTRLSEAIQDRDQTDLSPVATENLQAEFVPLGESVNLGSPQGLCAKARLEAQSMNIDYAAR